MNGADASPAAQVAADAAGEARFWAMVAKSDGCWLWTGATRVGYGAFKYDGKVLAAHRLAYELVAGPIPATMQLDHLCRAPSCVRPDHLEPVPQRVNILRGTGLTAINARKTHCVRGHEFTPENTRERRDRPGRVCRACKRLSNAERPSRAQRAA